MKYDKLQARKANDFSANQSGEWYRKSDVDEAIAELKEKLRAANEQVENLINSASSIMLFQDKANDNKVTELRHANYKRCEALAKLCAKNIDHLNSEGYIYEKEGHTEELADCIIKTEFYDKWYHRWLELAEKFKEVK